MRKPAGERGAHGLSTVVGEVWNKKGKAHWIWWHDNAPHGSMCYEAMKIA